ncbi:MAG: hypothetical protein NTZ55_04055, partial [Candidatus Roizmanbacteria bacterium]|nr:hypothetical protein [Candidatus Roizmanbacteria bacterium]
KRIWKIPDTRNTRIADIEALIELPLVNAVKKKKKKGIRTYWSTANAREHFAAICIEPRYLSETNIAFARANLGFQGREEENVMLQRPITPSTPIEEVDHYFVGLANQFADQN